MQRPTRNQQTGAGAKEAEQQVLGQCLADHAAARGANSDSHRQLAAAAEHAFELKIGDIRAGNQEHQSHGAEKGEQRTSAGRRTACS